MSDESATDVQVPLTAVPLTSEHPVARVDLLPPEIIAGRRFRRARGWMVVSVVGTLLLVGGVFWLAAEDAENAATELAVERARTTELNTEAARYAAVPAILASVDRAETALDTAMSSDVEWYRYLSQMAVVAPEGVWFTSMTMTAVPPTGVPGADPLSPVDAIGDVQTVGRGLTYDDVATWMDKLSSVSGYDHVLLTSTTRDAETGDEPFVEFQVGAKVLPEAYSNRYVPEAE